MEAAYLEGADLLKALSNPIRLFLVHELYLHESRTVSQLLENSDCSQSMISQSLGKLKDMGIVRMERKGAFSCYSLVDEKVKEIIEIIFNHL